MSTDPLKNWTLDTSDWPLIINGPEYPRTDGRNIDGHDMVCTIECASDKHFAYPEHIAREHAALIVQAPAMRDELTKLRAQVETQARDLHAYGQRMTQLGRALFVCRDALKAMIEADEYERCEDLAALTRGLWAGPSDEAKESHMDVWDQRHPEVVAARAALSESGGVS